MRAPLLAAALLALAAPQARADWEYARWGMTPEQVAQAAPRGTVRVIPPAERRRLPDTDLTAGAEGSFAEGALRLSVRFGFDAKGLAMVVYGVADPAQNEALRAWLVRRHGAPQRMGGLPAIGMQTLTWDAEDEVELTLTEGERAFVLHEPKPSR